MARRNQLPLGLVRHATRLRMSANNRYGETPRVYTSNPPSDTIHEEYTNIQYEMRVAADVPSTAVHIDHYFENHFRPKRRPRAQPET